MNKIEQALLASFCEENGHDVPTTKKEATTLQRQIETGEIADLNGIIFGILGTLKLELAAQNKKTNPKKAQREASRRRRAHWRH